MKNIEKQIREDWFKDHKAELQDLGEIQVLTWKKPGTGIYGIRCIFDGYRMYITGDLGEAVFLLTWKATIHSFADVSIDYFSEKLVAFSDDRWAFNAEKAVKRLREWVNDLKESQVSYNHNDVRRLFEEARSCDTVDEWHWIVNKNYDWISNLDPDYFEWLFDIGDEYPARLQSYLIGLKMASEQLKASPEATPLWKKYWPNNFTY